THHLDHPRDRLLHHRQGTRSCTHQDSVSLSSLPLTITRRCCARSGRRSAQERCWPSSRRRRCGTSRSCSPTPSFSSSSTSFLFARACEPALPPATLTIHNSQACKR